MRWERLCAMGWVMRMGSDRRFGGSDACETEVVAHAHHCCILSSACPARCGSARSALSPIGSRSRSLFVVVAFVARSARSPPVIARAASITTRSGVTSISGSGDWRFMPGCGGCAVPSTARWWRASRSPATAPASPATLRTWWHGWRRRLTRRRRAGLCGSIAHDWTGHRACRR